MADGKLTAVLPCFKTHGQLIIIHTSKDLRMLLYLPVFTFVPTTKHWNEGCQATKPHQQHVLGVHD